MKKNIDRSIEKKNIKKAKKKVKQLQASHTGKQIKALKKFKLNKESFDEIGERFGEQILANVREYESIYDNYGPDVYRKTVPIEIRMISAKYIDTDPSEFKKKHGRFVCKQNDFRLYEKNLVKNGIKGNKKNFLLAWYKVRKRTLPMLATIIAGNFLIIPLRSEMYNAVERNVFKSQIEEYEEDIKQDAEKVKQYDLDDFENVMYVMERCWQRYKGYGDPSYDVCSYLGMDMYMSGIGVCRNIADDYARRLNAVNPDFDATVIDIKLVDKDYSKNDQVEYNNIKTKIYEKKSEYLGSGLYESRIADVLKSKRKVANHAVVLVKMSDDDVLLMVDPTSAAVGYMEGDKIIYLNIKDDNQSSCYCPIEALSTGFSDCFDSIKFTIKGMKKQNREELELKYGVDAQNEALDSADQKVWVYEQNEIFEENGVDCKIEIEDSQSGIGKIKIDSENSSEEINQGSKNNDEVKNQNIEETTEDRGVY